MCVCAQCSDCCSRTQKPKEAGFVSTCCLLQVTGGRRAEHQASRPRVAPSAPQSSADCRQADARRAPTHVTSARSCASPDVTPSGHGPRVATQKPERGEVNDHLTTVLQANSLHSYYRHAHKEPVVPTTINSPLFRARLFARSHPVSDGS